MRSEQMPMRLICCNKEDFVRWRGTQEFFWALLLASNQVAQVWFFPTAGCCTFFLQKPWTWGVDAFQLPSSKSASQMGHSLTLISVHKKFIKRSNSISMCFTLSNAPKGEFGSWIQFFLWFLKECSTKSYFIHPRPITQLMPFHFYVFFLLFLFRFLRT